MKNLTDFIRFSFRTILLFPLKLLFWLCDGKWKFWKKKTIEQYQTTTPSFQLLPSTSSPHYAISSSYILTGSYTSTTVSNVYSSGTMPSSGTQIQKRLCGEDNQVSQSPNKPITINTHIFKE